MIINKSITCKNDLLFLFTDAIITLYLLIASHDVSLVDVQLLHNFRLPLWIYGSDIFSNWPISDISGNKISMFWSQLMLGVVSSVCKIQDACFIPKNVINEWE